MLKILQHLISGWFLLQNPSKLDSNAAAAKSLYSLSSVPANMNAWRRLISKLSLVEAKKQMIFIITNSSSGDCTIQSAPKKKHIVSHKPFSPQLYTIVLNHRFLSAMWRIDTSPSPNGLWSWSDHRTFFRKVPAACEFHGIWNSYLPPILKCRKRTKVIILGYNLAWLFTNRNWEC